MSADQRAESHAGNSKRHDVREAELDHFDHFQIGTVIALATRMQTEVHVRTELRLAPPVSGGQGHDELIAFAGFCAARIARGLRGISAWDLYVVGGLDGQSDAVVRVRVGIETVEVRARACDPAHAIWNAMCDVEQPLREAAATRAAA